MNNESKPTPHPLSSSVLDMSMRVTRIELDD